MRLFLNVLYILQYYIHLYLPDNIVLIKSNKEVSLRGQETWLAAQAVRAVPSAHESFLKTVQGVRASGPGRTSALSHQRPEAALAPDGH